jgi:hypothetical protein
MSRARAKIVFHLGQHKTGTKALQSFLTKHARALEGRGILYPTEKNPSHGIRAYAISHYRMFALLRREVMVGHGEREAALRFWEDHRAFCHPFDSLRGFFESLEAQRARTGAGTILLSAEDLFDLHSAHEPGFSLGWVESGAHLLARMAAELDYEPVVVVYIRRQDHLLGAHYVQYIKGSPVHDLDFESFAQAFAPRLRTLNILEAWASAFGAERIQARLYEPSVARLNIVPDFFQAVLKFSVPGDWASPPTDVESVNATPDRDYVEFMRILNHRNALGLPVFNREDVLEAALGAKTRSGAGIAEWLSPIARRALLQLHAPDNAQIAERFMGRPGGSLFAEPAPEANEEWQDYPGLSAERAIAIAQDIHKIASRRLSLSRIEKRGRWRLNLFRFLGGRSGRFEE